MDEGTMFAWEVAEVMGISPSKFLRTAADDIPCQKKGGVRLYLRSDVGNYLSGSSAATKQKEKDNGK
jgi:hypothetical protein